MLRLDQFEIKLVVLKIRSDWLKIPLAILYFVPSHIARNLAEEESASIKWSNG